MLPNYLTPSGAKALKDELRKLLYEERPALVKTVSWAASNGDRSENGDYIYGKKRLREIDRRIGVINKKLDQVRVVDPKEQANRSDGKILFGATVTIENEDGVTKTYQIVGVDETVPSDGKISWISPLGKALLGRKMNDVTTLVTPQGSVELTILKVEYI